MTNYEVILLFLAGALGGAVNAVAGGGSFVTFPALLFAGVGPLAANATSTIALWIGTTASGGAYRSKLKTSRRVMVPLLATSVLGGLIGAFLLIKTPPQTFMRVIPWLMLSATLLFAFGRHLTSHISARIDQDAGSCAIAGAAGFELLVAIYGGYFGGGMGIVNLAMLASLGMTDMHAMNALKVVLGSTTNGMATVMFVLSGLIAWHQAIAMTLGALAGGYATAHFAQKLPQEWIRRFVIAAGLSTTIYFLIKAYRQ
ncbi:MAG: sulfite exporter TauE/SafE family protein [Candidatus Acidiferrum sp.]